MVRPEGGGPGLALGLAVGVAGVEGRSQLVEDQAGVQVGLVAEVGVQVGGQVTAGAQVAGGRCGCRSAAGAGWVSLIAVIT